MLFVDVNKLAPESCHAITASLCLADAFLPFFTTSIAYVQACDAAEYWQGCLDRVQGLHQGMCDRDTLLWPSAGLWSAASGLHLHSAL